MRRTRWLVSCALALLLVPWGALAAPVYHLRSETNAPYEKDAAFLDASPFCADAALVQVDVLGIRQGDCIVVYAGGQTMLIDGGEGDRFADLARYLQDRGMDGFDVVFLTHAHADHLQAQEKLVRAGYRVGKVISPYDSASAHTLWQAYRKLLEKTGIPYEKIAPGAVIALGGATLTLYQWIEKGLTLNDQSAAAMLQYGDARLFLAADISGMTQHWLLAQYGADAFACDLYKSAHHGIGAVVPEFLDALSPAACAVTNTRANAAAHERQLDRRNIARYYITMGTIHMQTDGQQWLMWQGPGL